MAIALYPGAFKPPHAGHFSVVEKLLNGNHGGILYDKETIEPGIQKALQGDKDEIEKIDKVVVFIGGGVRNGISQDDSEKVWNIYAKYLPNVEIIASGKNPMMEAKDYAKQHPDEQFYAITGVRGEEDAPDLARITSFKNTPNVQGLIFPASGPAIRATNFRQAILRGSLDDVLEFFPNQLSRKEILDILTMLKQGIIAEMMSEKLDAVINDLFTVEQEEVEQIQENSSGTPIAPQPVMKSADRAKLVRVYEQLRDTLGDNFYNIEFKGDHVAVYLKQKSQSPQFDYTPYMASILEYMIDQGMKITPLPEVKVKKDLVEAEDFFGKTAYYNPQQKEIVLYTQGRHPKDVMRSFAHEMIHHKQNLEGRLGSIGTTNTNEDDHLLEIEKEAYLEGNITFRNWEDSIKNENKKVVAEDASYNEYEEFASELAQDLAIKLQKSGGDQIKKKTKIRTEIEGKPFIFKLQYVLGFSDETKDLDAEAFATTDSEEDDDDYKKDDLIEVYITINPNIPRRYELMELTLFHFLVHEMEHLLHGEGTNRISGRHIKEDPKIRALINLGALPAYQYRLLPKEIASAVREFAAKAKATGNSFAQEVNAELDKEKVSEEERGLILRAYRKYIKKHNLDLEL